MQMQSETGLRRRIEKERDDFLAGVAKRTELRRLRVHEQYARRIKFAVAFHRSRQASGMTCEKFGKMNGKTRQWANRVARGQEAISVKRCAVLMSKLANVKGK